MAYEEVVECVVGEGLQKRWTVRKVNVEEGRSNLEARLSELIVGKDWRRERGL